MCEEFKKYTASEMELHVTFYFRPKRYLIVPNVSWGFLDYREADILLINDSNYLSEVEIKLTKSDLIAGEKKKLPFWKRDRRIRSVWYAVPQHLESACSELPKEAGILSVRCERRDNWHRHNLEVVRRPKVKKEVGPLRTDEIAKLLYLAGVRLWGFKRRMWEIKRKTIFDEKMIPDYQRTKF